MDNILYNKSSVLTVRVMETMDMMRPHLPTAFSPMAG